ncbi:MAG: 3'(2'),5'-bisphosphate nucleotidase CysQ [Alphaproteobacteria bacterium]|nr:3'(2'),5'-bisphosphate nucleotidase CysQ [Alphaproteobacteria bacterium]
MESRSDIASLADVHLLAELTALVSRAAAAIAALDASSVVARQKPDSSPVTVADEAAQDVILAGLSSLLPGTPVVSEEAVGPVGAIAPGATFILVDPLDGTREYLAGRSEYTVNVAVIIAGRPAIGVIAAPAKGLIWRGIVGRGSERLRLPPGAAPDEAPEIAVIHARRRSLHGFVATVSRSHIDARTEAFLARVPVIERIACGSAIKFCRIAEGYADLYPRLAPTMEWDIAAGDAILAAAGGTVTTPDGAPLVYGRSDVGFKVPAFVAWGDPAAARRVLQKS